MKKLPLYNSFILLFLLLSASGSFAQNLVNWTDKQLVEPADLANTLRSGKDLPVIISVGPGAIIPGSLENGMASSKEGMEKLKAQLKNVKKDEKIIIYCGCCPFEHCPNVRPAITLLKELKFTNYYLLDLPHNIKTDWIDKNYPVSKS
jgi:thiosulfate/3-mercaptopyruvate sulfurtransferase